jgi:hypothetical protein
MERRNFQADFNQSNQQTVFFKVHQNVEKLYLQAQEEKPENLIKLPLQPLDDIFESKYEPN